MNPSPTCERAEQMFNREREKERERERSDRESKSQRERERKSEQPPIVEPLASGNAAALRASCHTLSMSGTYCLPAKCVPEMSKEHFPPKTSQTAFKTSFHES